MKTKKNLIKKNKNSFLMKKLKALNKLKINYKFKLPKKIKEN